MGVGMRHAPWLVVLATACGGPTPELRRPLVLAPAPSSGASATPPPSQDSRPRKTMPHGRSLAVQDEQICAVAEGSLYCREDRDVSPEVAPAPPLFSPDNRVSIPGNVVDVVSSRLHVCAVNDGGRVFCWGDNRSGQRGWGDAKPHDEPGEVLGVSGAVAVEVSPSHSCAHTAAGEVYCWGTNWGGEAGHDTAYDGDAIDLIRPVRVDGVTDVDRLWLADRLTCARNTGGAVQCWGEHRPELGVDGPAPVSVSPLTSAQDLAFARMLWCRVGGDRDPVSCRGRGYRAWAELRRDEDTVFEGTEDGVELALGAQHACVRTRDGRVLCWGSAAGGVLGRELDDETVADPAPVPGVGDARELAVGEHTTCALGPTFLHCWGTSPYRERYQQGARAELVTRTRLPR